MPYDFLTGDAPGLTVARGEAADVALGVAVRIKEDECYCLKAEEKAGGGLT